MSLELYFLRSTEQKIVTDMLYYSQRVDTTDKKVQDFEELKIYDEFYGFTRKDLGLYAMKNSVVCGAVWSRKLNSEHKAQAYIDDETPVINIAVKPEFRKQGIASTMMEQFLKEASVLYQTLCVNVLDDTKSIDFFKKFGFEVVKNLHIKSFVDGKNMIVMKKPLQKQQPTYPTDEYASCKWLD